MRLGVMQPYIFPYIGYYQLIKAVDKFVIYDDVNFIKQGWINRNRILLNKNDFVFTIPLTDASSFKHIKDINLNDRSYPVWKDKFYKTLEQAYKKAPHYDTAINIVKSVLDGDSKSIADLAANSLIAVCNYLQIETKFVTTSFIYNNNALTAQSRIIDICKKEYATEYINSIGGQQLYSYKDFAGQGLILKFIQSIKSPYKQFSNEFINGLSIIDVLMFNSDEQINNMLNNYQLVTE